MPILDDSILAFTLLSARTASFIPERLQCRKFLVAISLQSVHPFLPSVGQLCSLVCSLPKVNLKHAAVSAIISTIAGQVRGARGSGKGSVSTTHFVKTAVVICSSQMHVHEFPLNACQLCAKMSCVISMCHLRTSLTSIMRIGVSSMKQIKSWRSSAWSSSIYHFFDPCVDGMSHVFLDRILVSFMDSIHEHRVSSLFSTAINTTNAPPVVVNELSRTLVCLATLPSDADHEAVEAGTRDYKSP